MTADAVRFVKLTGLGAADAAFQATASSVTREYITLAGRPLATVEAGQIAWVHADHLGTPQKMSDATGALVWDRQQRPFGADQALTGTASNPQRFPGQVYDPETGYHYNYFRDYDPSLGRYVESDPIGLDGGTNTYSYVGGNPLAFIDPRGLAAGRSCELTGSCPEDDGDPCGCFAKAFLGYEEAGLAATEVATGPYMNKPSRGISGGGRSGSRTSAWSTAVHHVNKRFGKSAATAAARTAGRLASRAVPYAGTALLIFDVAVFNRCMDECDEDECQQ